VDRLLNDANLAIVNVEPGRLGQEPSLAPAMSEFIIPAHWMDAYRRAYPFNLITKIEVQLRDGAVKRAHLIDRRGNPMLVAAEDEKLELGNIAALRAARGCLPSLRTRRWVEVSGK
jgi:hypothetical protein